MEKKLFLTNFDLQVIKVINTFTIIVFLYLIIIGFLVPPFYYLDILSILIYIVEVLVIVFISKVIWKFLGEYTWLKSILFMVYSLIAFYSFEISFNVDALQYSKEAIFEATSLNPNEFGIEIQNYFAYMILIPLFLKNLYYLIFYISVVYFIINILDSFWKDRLKQRIFQNNVPGKISQYLLNIAIFCTLLAVSLDINDFQKNYIENFLTKDKIVMKLVDDFFYKKQYEDEYIYPANSGKYIIAKKLNIKPKRYIFTISSSIDGKD